MTPAVDWTGLYFEDANELARATRNYTTRRIAAGDVRAVLKHSPPYDGYDLRDVLKDHGWRPRPKKPQAARLLELAVKAKAKLAPVDWIMSQQPRLRRAINAFLADLEEDKRDVSKVVCSPHGVVAEFSALGIVLRAVRTATDPQAAWEKVADDLGARFPALRLDREAFLEVWQAQKDKERANAEYRRYWREAQRIARHAANRALHYKRLGRQLYVEDLVFEHLWLGRPITEGDLAERLEPLTDQSWNARRALYDALDNLPPPRSFEALVRAAHKLLGGSGVGGQQLPESV